MSENKPKKRKRLKRPLKGRRLIRIDIPKSTSSDLSEETVSQALGRSVQLFGIVPNVAAYYSVKLWKPGDPAKLRNGGYVGIRALCTLPANTRGLQTDCGRFVPIGTKMTFKILLNTGRPFNVTMTKTFLKLGPHKQLIEELALLGYERPVVKTMISCLVDVLRRDIDNLKADGEVNLVRLGHLDSERLNNLFKDMASGTVIVTGSIPKGDSKNYGQTRSTTESARSSLKVTHKSRSGNKNPSE